MPEHDPLARCSASRRRRTRRAPRPRAGPPPTPSRPPPTRGPGRSRSCSPSPRAAPSPGRAPSRSGVSGQAPTTVCRIRYASFGSRQPPIARRHDRLPGGRISGDRDEPRAYVAAPLRVVRRRREQAAGGRARFAAWKSATESENRRGRRRPRSGPRSGSSGRRPCPRRPSRARAASSAGSGPRTRRARAPRAGGSAPAPPAAAPPPIAARSSSATCPASGLDIRAVDVEGRERAPTSASKGSFAASCAASSANVVSRLLELRLGRDLCERPPLAGQLLVEPRQRLLRGRVDEERRDVVEELVAGRPLDRPVARSRSPGSRIFSTQTRSIPASRSRSR